MDKRKLNIIVGLLCGIICSCWVSYDIGKSNGYVEGFDEGYDLGHIHGMTEERIKSLKDKARDLLKEKKELENQSSKES